MKPIASYSGVGLANGRQSAAKTGTVGLDSKTTNNSDAWMVGFTPQVSAAVWVGTGLSKPIYNSDGSPLYGANMPGKTWKLFMDKYLSGHEAGDAADQAAHRPGRRHAGRDADLHADDLPAGQQLVELAEADVLDHERLPDARPPRPPRPAAAADHIAAGEHQLEPDGRRAGHLRRGAATALQALTPAVGDRRRRARMTA